MVANSTSSVYHVGKCKKDKVCIRAKWFIRPELILVSQHEATRSISTLPRMGCQSIAELSPALNSPVPIYTPACTWVERGTVRVKCLKGVLPLLSSWKWNDLQEWWEMPSWEIFFSSASSCCMLLSLNRVELIYDIIHCVCLSKVNSCLCSSHVTYVPKRVSTMDARDVSHHWPWFSPPKNKIHYRIKIYSLVDDTFYLNNLLPIESQKSVRPPLWH